MTVSLAFIIILFSITLDFFAEQYLSSLNYKYTLNSNLPPQLTDIYSNEQYSNFINYYKDNYKLKLSYSVLSFIIIFSIVTLGLFGIIDNFVNSLTTNYFYQALLFFGILAVGNIIIHIPYEYYTTFVIEQRYNFNNTTLKTFILDKIKTYLISAILISLIIFILINLYLHYGKFFWAYAIVIITIISLIISELYPVIILPLFYKQTPLEEGEMRNAIEAYLKNINLKISNIYIMNASSRSNKTNAFFTGIGKFRRIVLFDTIIKNHTKEEIIAIIAHEAGHYKHRHTLISILLFFIQTALILYFFSIIIDNIYFAKAIGAQHTSFHIGITASILLFSIFNIIISPLFNMISRHFEYQADKFVKQTYNEQHLISALKKLTTHNLSNINPHPAYVSFYYSHPTLLQRIQALEK